MLALKFLGIVLLIALWGGIGWMIAHRRRIERELVKNEAMPRQTTSGWNFLLLLAVVVTGLSGLILYLVFGR